MEPAPLLQAGRLPARAPEDKADGRAAPVNVDPRTVSLPNNEAKRQVPQFPN
jgi:hypothetical protein